ncbi:hypothetical protein EOM09_00565 [bacterium]|nr:hypothetical protein [bacterium]
MFKKFLYLSFLNLLYVNKALALVSYKDNNYTKNPTDFNFFDFNHSGFSNFSPLLIILNLFGAIFLYLIIAKAIKTYVSNQCAGGVLSEDKKIASNIFYIILMFIYCLLVLRINFNYL